MRHPKAIGIRVVSGALIAAVAAVLSNEIIPAAATNIFAIRVLRDVTASAQASSSCSETPSGDVIEEMVPTARVARLRATHWLCATRPAEAELALSGLTVRSGRLSLLVRGMAGLELGHVDKALADLAAAGAAPYFLNRGLQLEEQGRLAEAIVQADLALQIDPELLPALLASGRMHGSADHWDIALRRLETAATVSDGGLRPAFWRDLGYATYQVTGNQGAAAGYFQRAIDEDPGDPQTLVLFAEVAVRSGDYTSGRAALQKAVALAPDDDATLVEAAKVFFKAAEPEAALVQQLLESRIARANGDVFGEVYFYLGIALERLHDEQGALAMYVTAHERYPSDLRWPREIARVRSIIAE